MPAKRISCIIPAYNEEKGIAAVLKAACGHPLLEEVIVIDDASKDRTSEIAKTFPEARLVRHDVNRGKSMSVADGIAAARGNFICSLDADLIGITPDSITRLVEPILSGNAVISISLRQNCPWFYRPIGIDFLSGERVYPKQFLGDHLDELRRLPKFGIEVFMNRLIIKQRIPIAIVFLPGVISPLKYHKAGLLKGFLEDAGMVRDILKTISVYEFASQIFHLMRLRVHPNNPTNR